VLYLFDTDHLSILQKSTGQDYDNLSRRMEKIPISDFAISIVTVHEQLLGSHTYINRARDETQLLRGYEMMVRLVGNLKVIPTVSFERGSLTIFKELKSQQIKVATMDLRIASIAISHSLILLTRNHKDFNQVPKLSIEDWTHHIYLRNIDLLYWILRSIISIDNHRSFIYIANLINAIVPYHPQSSKD
jgi:tRNA(fMet)-specific endonuclease VapC